MCSLCNPVICYLLQLVGLRLSYVMDYSCVIKKLFVTTDRAMSFYFASELAGCFDHGEILRTEIAENDGYEDVSLGQQVGCEE